jgi:hypothetical protein
MAYFIEANDEKLYRLYKVSTSFSVVIARKAIFPEKFT